MTDKTSRLLFAAALLVCATFAHAQVPVAIAPPLHPKFTDNSGNVLASGFLYTYDAGTTNLRPTYVDSTGIVQNPDPIPLDATGTPTNGSVQTGIWLANQAYKFCAYNAALVQQWCMDNVTGYLGLLNTANTWNFAQTFSLPIVDLAIDNQFVTGSPGNQTTLDFPPPAANVTLHFPTTADTMVGRNTTDTLTNKTLTAPALNTPTVNGTPIIFQPGTYALYLNQNPTGTILYSLAKAVNAPSQAQLAATTDTGGILGVCVSACGTTNSATIQQSGITSCTFDATATVAGDYVQTSATTAGACHDAGASYPNSGQVLGRVLVTSGGGSTLTVDLFGPEITAKGTVCANAVAVVVNPPAISPVSIETCAFPAGALNQVGKTFRLIGTSYIAPASSYTSALLLGMGPTSALASQTGLVSSSASGVGWWAYVSATCTVQIAGASGTVLCTPFTTPQTLGVQTFTYSFSQFGLGSLNLTQPVYLGFLCTMGTSNAANACTNYQFSVEQLN